MWYLSFWIFLHVLIVAWFVYLDQHLFDLCDKNLIYQVMSVKAIGIAIKLTIEGSNQAIYFQTWIFVMVLVTCVIVQLNFLNMVSAICFLCDHNFLCYELMTLINCLKYACLFQILWWILLLYSPCFIRISYTLLKNNIS